MARYRVVPRRVIPADYINDMKQRIDNLRKAVIKKNEDIERLKATIRALAKERAEVLRQKDALEKEKESLNKEKESIESVINENKRLKDENAKLGESVKALHDRISSFEEQLKNYDARIKEDEEKVKGYEELLNGSKEHAQQLERVIKQKDEEISKLKEEIDGYVSAIAEKESIILEKESVIAEKDAVINEYAARTSELNKYLLEIRELKLSDKNAMLIFRATLAIGFIFGIVGAIFAIFAEPIVVSMGIDYVLRTKVAVTFLAMALPLCMISVTFRLFATRASVFYLNTMALVVSAATVVLFDIYYPDNFLHPFAGTLYFLYTLAVAMHFTALLLALPKVHRGSEPEAGEQGEEAEQIVPEPSEDKEKDEEDLFKFLDEK